MNRQQHWETVYGTKASDAVSWYRPHLDHSLRAIERVAPDRDTAILDVGGGASTLVDDLLSAGYRDLSVLDISAQALDVARQRLGERADNVTWLAADLLDAPLPAARYQLWHDRAVFHFLTQPEQQAAYVAKLTHAIRPDGYAAMATFGPEGPMKCSGLDAMRYDADELARVLGSGWVLLDSELAMHATPSGTSQQFLHALFQHRTEAAQAR